MTYRVDPRDPLGRIDPRSVPGPRGELLQFLMDMVDPRPMISDAWWSATHPLDRIQGEGRADVPYQAGELTMGPGGQIMGRVTSALRNAAQKPVNRTMYHGTNVDFDAPKIQRHDKVREWYQENALGRGYYLSNTPGYATDYGRKIREEQVNLGPTLNLMKGWSGPEAEKVARQAALRDAHKERKWAKRDVSPEEIEEVTRRNIQSLRADDYRASHPIWGNRPEMEPYWRLRQLPGVENDYDARMVLRHAGYSSLITKNDYGPWGGLQAVALSPKAQTKVRRVDDVDRDHHKSVKKAVKARNKGRIKGPVTVEGKTRNDIALKQALQYQDVFRDLALRRRGGR